MDDLMHKSSQHPALSNFDEPKYVKNPNLTASPAARPTQSQMLKTHAFQPERDRNGIVDPIGPGTYDVEKSLEFTKPRHPSPDLGK